jgi:ribonuclease D
VILVDSPAALRTLSRELGGVSAIGVDTEGNSFFVYRERTCLLQISTRSEDYLVDPIALPDLAPLRSVFADASVLKVYHAADNDVAALKRDFGLATRCLFDTMLAARILGLPRWGLADLLREFFGVESNKRMQRHDWGARPLELAAVRYAAMDSHYLLPLHDVLQGRLAEAGRLEEAEEEFARVEQSEASTREFDPESFWRLKGAYDLAPSQRAGLRELYIWRDRQAAATDRPPFRIVPDHFLVAVAAAWPANQEALEQVAGMPPSIARRYGSSILAALQRGATAPAPQELRPARREGAELDRYEALRRWRRQAAAARGVEPDVIVSNAVLSALAASPPQSEDELRALAVLGPWKLRAYGPALLGVLNSKMPV